MQMSKIIEFFKYILHCLLSFFSSAIGSTPDDFTLKEFVTAVTTLIVIMIFFYLIKFILKKSNLNSFISDVVL